MHLSQPAQALIPNTHKDYAGARLLVYYRVPQNIVTLADGHGTLCPYPSSAERITVICETQQD